MHSTTSLPAAGEQSPPKLVAFGAASSWWTPGPLFLGVVVLIVCLGWNLPTARYITPQTGLGYALGVAGGSMMILLLLYSARKRLRWLQSLGRLPKWFELHMTLGIIGPLCILFHANFRLGATNSNVALLFMLTVVLSGLIGRYFYSRVHYGLYGRRMQLAELLASAQQLRAIDHAVPLLPELVSRLQAHESRILASGVRLPMLRWTKPLAVALNAERARWALHHYVRKALRLAARDSADVQVQSSELYRAAMAYVQERLLATRRVAEFAAYERLLSLWLVLHVPITFMLLLAGTSHVIAVHMY